DTSRRRPKLAGSPLRFGGGTSARARQGTCAGIRVWSGREISPCRSADLGPIDTSDARHRKSLSPRKEIAAVREAMEMNVFPIFPNCFLHLHHAGDLAAAFKNFARHIVDRVAWSSFPGRTPDNPPHVIDAENKIREPELAGSFVDWILTKDPHRLRQAGVKVSGFHSVIHDQDIAWFGVLAQKPATLRDRARIRFPQIADVHEQPAAEKTVDHFCRNMSADRIFAEMHQAAGICGDPWCELSEFR